VLNKLVIATGNTGKLKEIQALLAPIAVEVLSQAEFNIPEADEPYFTFVENALTKARHASLHSGLPALGHLCQRIAGRPRHLLSPLCW
jgi:XTP/dITP diphosphohydrolase